MIKDPDAEDYSNFDEAISDSEDEVIYCKPVRKFIIFQIKKFRGS